MTGLWNNAMLRTEWVQGRRVSAKSKLLGPAKTVEMFQIRVTNLIPYATERPTSRVLGELWEVPNELAHEVHSLELRAGYRSQIVKVELDGKVVDANMYLSAFQPSQDDPVVVDGDYRSWLLANTDQRSKRKLRLLR